MLTALLLAGTLSAAPTAGTAAGMLSLEPGPVDFSAGFNGRASEDGRVLQLIEPGAHPWFIDTGFAQSAYRIDCQTPYVLARTRIAGSDPEWQESHVCRILDAPVVNAGFIDELKHRGFRFALSFPYRDPRNERALIFWSDNGIEAGRAPKHQGFARIEGVGWKDQYQPAARCLDPDVKCVWHYFEHGDAFGAFINRFPSPDRETAARSFQLIGFDPVRKEAVTGTSVVIDSWLGAGPENSSADAILHPTCSADRQASIASSTTCSGSQNAPKDD